MGKRFLYSLFLFIFVVSMWLPGCEDQGAATNMGNETTHGLIAVEPSGSVSLGYFEDQIFRVKITDSDGTPMVGEPVIVSFIGPAYNSHIEPSVFDTDETGIGEIVFTAPDKVASFPIRFTSPAIDEAVIVDVVVDPTLIELSVNVSYSGKRQIDSFEAALFEESSCEDLAGDDGIEPVQTIKESKLPAAFKFSGLRHGKSYALQVHGLNPEGDIRVVSCLDALVPDGDVVNIELVDMPFSGGGNFNLTIEISPDGAMDRAVDELATLMDKRFANNPAKHILNEVRQTVVKMDPLAGVAYDELRNRFLLDELLAAHFSENSIDVAGSLDSMWLAIKDYFFSVTLRSRLGIGSPEEETYSLAHHIDKIEFLNEDGDLASVLFTSEFGKGSARLDENDADLLHVDEHTIAFGLGFPTYILLMLIIDDQMEAESFNQAMYQIVDCDRVADVLEPKLNDIANWATIRSGCESATVLAEGWLTTGVALLDYWYTNLVLEGSCRLDGSPTGLQAISLVDGELDVSWKGLSLIGPMKAVFKSDLPEDP
ncbi:MAG: hypothetical protein GY854_17925 [Deltaproteobacteria bacterium]|nr:hypothetical protein [Deltaproteobacteria bacterium]